MKTTRRRRRGFSLVELMMVVAIIGILAALGSYGVRSYVARAHAAEAVANLGGIRRSVLVASDRETMVAEVLDLKTSSTDPSSGTTTGGGSGGKGKGKGKGATVTHDGNAPVLCSTSTLVPEAMAEVTAKKYQSSPEEWRTGDINSGWTCLKFEITGPQRYQYGYKTGGPPVRVKLPHGGSPPGLSDEESWSAYAQGDLDGDGDTSWFVIEGAIVGGKVYAAPAVGVEDGEE